MLVRNWMRKDPPTIPSDMTARDAHRLFNDLKTPFIPVVDSGRLRGLLARRDIRQAASFVTASDSVHEMNFFNNRMKVKDLMVRKPVTLSIDDTVETALLKGSEFGRTFFPVMEGDRLVGTVSDRDIFRTLRQILGVDEKLYSVTLENDFPAGDAIKDIVLSVYQAGAFLYSLFTLADPESGKKRLLMRIRTQDPDSLKKALKQGGLHILEAVDRLH